MYQLWELFFCPQHGLLRPTNWVFIGPALAGVGVYLRSILHYVATSAAAKHFDNLRRIGVI